MTANDLIENAKCKNLTKLSLRDIEIVDLSPLRGMPLLKLALRGTKVSDLSPLRGMSLDELWITDTPVALRNIIL